MCPLISPIFPPIFPRFRELVLCPPISHGFFLPLAGITTVKQIRENAFDIKATGRLNRLYVELLRENPDWDTAARRPDLNHFFARLIFCFFAQDTSIFHGAKLFTATIEQMSERDSSNTHEVLCEVFRAMNTRAEELEAAGVQNWARSFPFVNGGLFSGSMDVPRFSRIARSYLFHVGSLDWTKINPYPFTDRNRQAYMRVAAQGGSFDFAGERRAGYGESAGTGWRG